MKTQGFNCSAYKLYFLCSLFFLFSCSNEKNLVVYENLGDTYVRHQYKDQQTSTQLISTINAFIPNADSFIHPIHTVTVFRVFYTTHDYQNNVITASGLVYVPEIRNYFVPIVCYQHGTAIKKQEVPSISADLGYYAPFIIASETGAIVCAADYIGLGLSDGVQHFYEPGEEANAVTDMLGAVQTLLTKTARKLTFDKNIFLYGYSQGGHATLAAQRKLETKYAHQFQVKASAPCAGWFALEKSTQLNVLTASVDFSFSSAYAFLINSIQTTQQVYPSYQSVFIAPYDSLTNELFDGSYATGYINAQYPIQFSSALQGDFKNELTNNPDNAFKQAVRKYDVIYDWVPKAPTRFYHSEGDEVAFYENSEIAFTAFKNKGGNVELISLGNYNHFDANIISFQELRDWFYPLIKITPY